MFDLSEVMYGDITAEEVGLKQQEVTEYDKYFLDMGSAHGFVIMVYQNGSDQEQPCEEHLNHVYHLFLGQ